MTRLMTTLTLAAALAALAGTPPVAAAESGAKDKDKEFAKVQAAKPRASAGWDPGGGFRSKARSLDESVQEWVQKRGLGQEDGTLYAADVAPLLLYAARTGNEGLYTAAFPAAQRLIVMDKSDPYAQGFVLSRRKVSGGYESAGATESLQMARALWEGAESLDRAGDRELALKVLDGYSKFAYELNGTWLVRRNFEFASRTFSGLSTLSNYDADFLELIERRAPRPALSGFARRSYSLLTRAVAPSGLLYPLVQPEIGATYPGLGADVYGANGIVALEESCRGAEGASRGQPDVARTILRFARERASHKGKTYAYFGAEEGDRQAEELLSVRGVACLGRLAAAVRDVDGLEALEDPLTDAMKRASGKIGDRPGALGTAASLLLAAQAVGAIGD